MQVIHRQQRVCDFSRMVHHYGLLYLPSWSQNSGDTRRAGQGWRASTEQWDQYRPLCVRRDKRSAARALQNYLQWANHVHVLLPNLNTETMTVALRSFSGTCVHNRTPCRLTGIRLRTPELAGPPTSVPFSSQMMLQAMKRSPWLLQTLSGLTFAHGYYVMDEKLKIQSAYNLYTVTCGVLSSVFTLYLVYRNTFV